MRSPQSRYNSACCGRIGTSTSTSGARSGAAPDDRKSIGFHDRSKAEAFESREVPVPVPNQNPSRSTRQDRTAVDREPHNTINKKYPALFIYDDSPRKEPISDLVHYCKRERDSEDLEKNNVNRWMDVPILIPEIDEKGRSGIRPWGKLSVDDAENSDRLLPRNVADLTVLTAVAGGAMAEKLRESPRTRGHPRQAIAPDLRGVHG